MFKIRAGIAVIIATILGIGLLIVSLSAAQEALEIKTVAKKDLFNVSGNARFFEQAEQRIWRPEKYLYVTLQDYPASFMIAKSTAAHNTAAYQKAMDTTVLAAIPRTALGLLQTRKDIKLYELSTVKGKVLFPFSDAVERDKADRLRLYLQTALCFLGGLVLLIVPKRYLVKQ